jgi:predicted exporter
MLSNKLLSDVYLYLSLRKPITFTVTLAIVLVSMVAFFHLNLHEDIRAMLPDDKSDAALNFKLIQQAPFSRKVIINLDGGTATSVSDLIAAVDRLAESMTPPFFSRVVTGPGESINWDFFSWLIDAEPNLIIDQDLVNIDQLLTVENTRRSLKEVYGKLLTAEGSALKSLFRIDPLDLRFIGLKKLRFLNLIPKMQLRDGHFISADGRNALLIADTPLEITDPLRARDMLSHFQRLAARAVPDTIDVSLISGHRYALANTDAIKLDIFIVLICSSVGLLLVFLIFLRTWGGFYVFLVPLSVFCIAAAGISIVYQSVSAVTIGFGAVLLGISMDFAIHVYFALQTQSKNVATAVAQVARPIFFCALTTLGSFGVLLFSSLPVQRQLAVFLMIGICVSIILSLITLPHLVNSAQAPNNDEKNRVLQKFQPAPNAVIVVWLLLLALCSWQATKLEFNGDLRALNLVPEDIRSAENNLQQTWGDFRGNAVIFAGGSDLQSALEANDRLFKFLAATIPGETIVSMAPIMPSNTTQKINRQRWHNFWTDEKKDHIRHLLTTEGQSLGFRSDAFAPFFERLERPALPITLEDLKALGLEEMVDSLIIKADEGIRVLTIVPDTPLVADLIRRRKSEQAEIQFASQEQFRIITSRAIADDFLWFIIKASLVVCLCMSLLFRNLKMILLALIPVVSGMLFMIGVMGALGIAFNLFNVVAAILIIGLGVDYGIFMVSKISNDSHQGTEQALFVSGLTTLAGFGALVLARHPALHSIGLTVLLGIVAAIPSALMVIPAIFRYGVKSYE